MIAFSLPSPRCECFDFEIRKRTDKSPIATGTRRQDEWLTFYASTRLSGCRDAGRAGVLQVQRPRRAALVGPAENGTVLRRVTAIDASAAAGEFPAEHSRLIYWDAAHGGAGFLLDFGFAVAAAAPGGEGEAAFHGLLQVVVGRGFAGVGPAEGQRLVKERLVNFNEQFLDCGWEVGQRGADLAFPAGTVAPGQHGGLLGHVFGTEFHADRNATHFPVVELPARAEAFALVQMHAEVGLDQLRFQVLGGLENAAFFFVGFIDRHDYGLNGGDAWRQNQALVVAVDHDNR